MQAIIYNKLQARVLNELIKDPEKLRTLHTVTQGRTKEYFNGPYLPFYLAVQLLSDKGGTCNVDWVTWVAYSSKAGKTWASSIPGVVNDIRTAEPTENFGALVAKMVKSANGVKKPLPPVPIKRHVLSHRVIGFLEVSRKKLGVEKWNGLKKQLNINTPGVGGLSRGQASVLIDYIKSEKLLK
jgi:hypothetical protein